MTANVPHTFANVASQALLSDLDGNFTTIYGIVNSTPNNTTVSAWVSGNSATAFANAIANAASNAAGLYQTTAGLSANVLTMTANAAGFLGDSTGTLANIQAWIVGNVATGATSLTANTATYLGNAYGTQANIASWVTTNAAAAYSNAVANAAALYQTTAGLSANVLTMTSNSTLFLGNSSGTLANIAAWIAGNVTTGGIITTANTANYLNDSTGTLLNIQSWITGNSATAYTNATSNAAALYQTKAGLSANVLTLTANASGFLGNAYGTQANIASWITGNAATAYSNAIANAASNAAGLYQTTAGLSANVATLTANAAGYLGNSWGTQANIASWVTTNAAAAYNNAVAIAAVAYTNATSNAAALYQTKAGLAANVLTLTSNAAGFLGNAYGTQANIASWVTTNAAAAFANAIANAASNAAGLYQTTAGLSANVLTLTSNAAGFLGNAYGTLANIQAWIVGNAATGGVVTTANTATYLGNAYGTQANISSWITGNAATAYSNAVANAAALYLTTSNFTANLANITIKNGSANLANLTSALIAVRGGPGNPRGWYAQGGGQTITSIASIVGNSAAGPSNPNTATPSNGEFAFGIDYYSNTGKGSTGSTDATRTGLYVSTTAGNNSGAAWAFNPVLSLTKGSVPAGKSQIAEFDLAQFTGTDYGEPSHVLGLNQPAVFGMQITGLGYNRATSAVAILGDQGGIFNITGASGNGSAATITYAYDAGGNGFVPKVGSFALVGYNSVIPGSANVSPPGYNTYNNVLITESGSINSTTGYVKYQSTATGNLSVPGTLTLQGPLWNRGITAYPQSISQSFLEDYSYSDTSYYIQGLHKYGIDTKDGFFTNSTIRLGTQQSVSWRNAADSADLNMLQSTGTDDLLIGTGANSVIINTGKPLVIGGTIRMSAGGPISWRNAADSANLIMLVSSATDDLLIGTGANNVYINTGKQLRIGGAIRMPSQGSLYWLSNTGAADLNMLQSTGTNDLLIGTDASSVIINTTNNFIIGGSARLWAQNKISWRNQNNTANLNMLQSTGTDDLLIGTDANSVIINTTKNFTVGGKINFTGVHTYAIDTNDALFSGSTIRLGAQQKISWISNTGAADLNMLQSTGTNDLLIGTDANSVIINNAKNFTVGGVLFAQGGPIVAGTTGASQGTLKLNGSTSGNVTITTAPAAGTYTIVLPTNCGVTNQFLRTDGTGTTTWVTPVTSFKTSLSGLTPSGSTTGDITLAGTLGVSSGGTGTTTSTGTGNVVLSAAPVFTGNVGINTTAAAYTLDVTGNIRATANVYGTLATLSQPYITANNANYLGGVVAASYALLNSPTITTPQFYSSSDTTNIATVIGPSGVLRIGSWPVIGSTIQAVTTTQGSFANLNFSANQYTISIANSTVTSNALIIDSNTNIYSGTPTSNTMTKGFFYIPSGSGRPSGIPAVVMGHVPMYYDIVGDNFYVYNGRWMRTPFTYP